MVAPGGPSDATMTPGRRVLSPLTWRQQASTAHCPTDSRCGQFSLLVRHHLSVHLRIHSTNSYSLLVPARARGFIFNYNLEFDFWVVLATF